MRNVTEVLNLGAGVQSTAVLLMSERGELPPLDYAIFADTGWEPRAVYEHLAWLKGEVRKTPIVHLNGKNIRQDSSVAMVIAKKENGTRWSTLPFFVKTDSDTGKGKMKRQCTSEYKIVPIETWIRRNVLNLKKGQHAPKDVRIRQWFGISVDEWQRMRPSAAKWKTHWYPLVDKRISRHECLAWLHRNGYPGPPRSACIGCPYHSDAEWRGLRDDSPDEFADAVDLDHTIRKTGGKRGDVYLHQSLMPLDVVDLDSDVDRGQQLLWQDECEGMCNT